MKRISLRAACRVMYTAVVAALIAVGCVDNGTDEKSSRVGDFINMFAGDDDANANANTGGTPTANAAYTLTVNVSPPEGGTVSRSVNQSSYKAGESITLMAAPEAGYKFVSWSGALSATDTKITIVMDSDKTLTAGFRKEGSDLPTFDVYFNANGAPDGAAPLMASTVFGNSITLPGQASMENPGYSFAGWSESATGTGTRYDANTSYTVTRNVTLYAQWTPNPPPDPTTTAYTITFNPNGGNADETNAVTATDGRLTALPAPTRDGYTFKGWFTAPSGGTAVTVEYVFTKNTTIYAQWTVNTPTNPPATTTYTVTYNPNNGSVSPTSDVTNADGRLTYLLTPTRDGYTFKGWFTAPSGGAAVTVEYVFTKNTTIYAQWTVKTTYTITFNPNNGSVSQTSAVTDTDGRLTGLPTPTRNGYTFKGWFTATSGGTAVTVEYVFSKNTTIYAQWTVVALNAPTNVNAVAVSSSSITVSWSVVSGATEYRVYRSTSASGSYTNVGNTASASFTNTGLSSNTTYYYKVLAYNGGGESALSSSYGYATTNGTTPGAVTTFTDSRDGKTYKKVKIGNQTWMAENLNYSTASGSWCYNNSADSCGKYGRLYDWATAMGINKSYNTAKWGGSDENHRGICPSGWHLPSNAEWGTLVDFVGSPSGTKLKAGDGWYNYSTGVPQGNGTDDFGFSALPGGYPYTGGSFDGAGNFGNWWTATEYSDGTAADGRGMYYYGDVVFNGGFNKEYGLVVRCVED